jgi:hypothetical protein
MDALHGFKEVDMRDNPLNCTLLLHALDYKMTILSDCISKFLSTKPTVTKFNHSTAKYFKVLSIFSFLFDFPYGTV